LDNGSIQGCGTTHEVQQWMNSWKLDNGTFWKSWVVDELEEIGWRMNPRNWNNLRKSDNGCTTHKAFVILSWDEPKELEQFEKVRQWMSIRWFVTWESWKNKTMDKDWTNGGQQNLS
jgi:hypothetical protein